MKFSIPAMKSWKAGGKLVKKHSLLGMGLKGLKDMNWKGKKAKLKKFNTLSRKQRRTLDKLLGRISPASFSVAKSPMYKAGTNYLQNFLGKSFTPSFNAMDQLQNFEAPMMRQFREQIIPEIASRFSGLDARRSSAFEQALGSAGADLQERLAALKGGLALQAQESLGNQQAQFYQQQLQAAQLGLPYSEAPGQMSLNLANLGLGTPAFGYQNIPGQAGMGQGIMGGLGRIGGGLAGAAAGAAVGSVVPGIGTALGAGVGGAMGMMGSGA